MKEIPEGNIDAETKISLRCAREFFAARITLIASRRVNVFRNKHGSFKFLLF